MDEGTTLEETNISPWDILRNRHWLFNTILFGFCLLLVWLSVLTGFIALLLSPIGLIGLFIGVGISLVLQIIYDMDWSRRYPYSIPERIPFRQRYSWRNLIFSIIASALGFFTSRVLVTYFPWLIPHFLAWILGLLAFVLGVLLMGLWPSLAGLILWENREGVRIVKQGNKFIVLLEEEIHITEPGNT